VRDRRNVPPGVVPLRHLRGLGRQPYLAVGDGSLRVYRNGFREPWVVPAGDVAMTAPTPPAGDDGFVLGTRRGKPNLRLVLVRPYPPPRAAWWVPIPIDVAPRRDVVTLDVMARDVPSAVATLAEAGIGWTDDVASWRVSRGEQPEPVLTGPRVHLVDLVIPVIIIAIMIVATVVNWRSPGP
jgi:hypothetical protein